MIPSTAANENTSLHYEFPSKTETVSPPHPNVTAPSNPFQLQPVPAARLLTQTITARTVFHEAQVAIWPLIAGIQTQEQLDGLLNSFHGIQ